MAGEFWICEFDGPVSFTPIAPCNPMVPGWYGVMIAVDPHDGIGSDFLYPEALYWDGTWTKASHVTVVRRSPQPFESEDDASDWALQHDADNAMLPRAQ